MISHKHKCIFIHIPRTAGTSIEKWIAGDDWWHVEPSTKHLTASQAKKLYGPYWDDYFKFSFVRNPISRVSSMLKFDHFFGLNIDEFGNVDFSEYHRKHGSYVVLEHDWRFYGLADVWHSKVKEGSVYGNMLSDDMDFIGKYENLAVDSEHCRKVLGIADRLEFHLEASTLKPTRFSDDTKSYIGKLYAEDMVNFAYG